MTPQNITNSKELQLGSISVTVRELTVIQVRDWLAAMVQPGDQVDIIDQAFFHECSLSDLQRMTSLTHAQIDQLRPSDLRQVIALCKELNPDFFGFMARLVKPVAPTA